ncbi:hypothetical protein BGW39_011556 [Mortierella sp. 14UC]|nr:hypothetical protein BGW39_011556 [Mortierella sp. 14UC]
MSLASLSKGAIQAIELTILDMIVIPEILDHIATYLDADSLFVCVFVCCQWKDLFTPYLWRTVDPSVSPHSQIFACDGNQFQRQRWISTLLQNHKEHIRDMTIIDNGLLLASLDNNLMELHSLTLKRIGEFLWMKETEFFDEEFASNSNNNMDGDGVFSSALNTCTWKAAIPSFAFRAANWEEATQGEASWLLVQNNPGLRKLVFDRSWGTYTFETTWVLNITRTVEIIHPRSAAVLSETLSRMSLLQHVEIGLCADDHLLTYLATVLPYLKSFVHPRNVEFDPQAIISQPPHKALKRLVFRKSITMRQLRAVAVAFPALVYLSVERISDHYPRLQHNTDSNGNLTTPMDVLEWKFLESFDITGAWFDLNGVLDARIRLPKILRLDKGVHNIYPSIMFQQVLSTFPALLRLDYSGKHVRETTFIDKAFAHAHPVQELLLRKTGFQTCDVQSIFLRMPFLVHLEMDCFEFDGETVLELVRTYRKLERLQFDLREGCSRAMVDILNECPATLKTCRGDGHVVYAADVVEFAEWSSCTGLEELDIEIVGVPGLTKEQEAMLDNLWSLDPAWFEETMNAETAMPEDEEVAGVVVEAAVEQARKRALELGHTLTANEAEALHDRQFLHCLQRATYKRLGRLTQLRELNFHPGEYWELAEYAWTDRLFTLEHTLLAGFAGLASLVHLEAIRFMGPDFRAGEMDLDWMTKQWSMEKHIVNGQTHLMKAK